MPLALAVQGPVSGTVRRKTAGRDRRSGYPFASVQRPCRGGLDGRAVRWTNLDVNGLLEKKTRLHDPRPTVSSLQSALRATAPAHRPPKQNRPAAELLATMGYRTVN
eukprot:scaffold52879_cov14-Prasinocladus_malaysianus.AAC.1